MTTNFQILILTVSKEIFSNFRNFCKIDNFTVLFTKYFQRRSKFKLSKIRSEFGKFKFIEVDSNFHSKPYFKLYPYNYIKFHRELYYSKSYLELHPYNYTKFYHELYGQ